MAATRTEAHQGLELRREGATMALYVSVVLLAELAALPAEHLPKGWGIVALIWGTTLGLAIAHWFAFTLASSAIADGRLQRQDLEVGVAGALGAIAVAVAATVPEVLLSRGEAVRAMLFVPAAFIGLGGWVVARGGGRSPARAFVWALGFVAVGVLVAGLKVALSGH